MSASYTLSNNSRRSSSVALARRATIPFAASNATDCCSDCTYPFTSFSRAFSLAR